MIDHDGRRLSPGCRHHDTVEFLNSPVRCVLAGMVNLLTYSAWIGTYIGMVCEGVALGLIDMGRVRNDARIVHNT